MGFKLVAKTGVIRAEPVAKKSEIDIRTGTGFTKKLIEAQQRRLAHDENLALKDVVRAKATQVAKENLKEQAEDKIEVLNLPVIDPGFTWDQYQLAAIEGATKHRHFCLIGAAGSGKTTVLKAIIDKILDTIPITKTIDKDGNELETYNILFCSFTGRAVQVMKRALPAKFHPNCLTMHKALDYAPEDEAYFDETDQEWKEKIMFKPRFTAGNKFNYTIIVIDEGSMAPVKLFNELVDAAPENVRFIFVGDINQLPPVMDRPILPFAMMKYPTFELKEIHRQALDNPIIAASQDILNGRMPKADPRGIFIKGISDGSITGAQDVLKYTKLLATHGKFNGMTDALIVPTNINDMGQENLNGQLMDFFNPPLEQNGIIINRRTPIKARMGTKLFAINDKVMLLSNDNDLGLTNGQIGVVTDITLNGSFKNKHTEFHSDTGTEFNFDDFDVESLQLGSGEPEEEVVIDDKTKKAMEKEDNQRQASHIMTVRFPSVNGEEVEAKFASVGQYSKVSHAYAFTCHKSQGGEYPTVIVAFHSSQQRMLNREWLYTAVTRARNSVYILCNTAGLKAALKNQSIRGNTVEEKAKSFLKQIQGKEFTTPNLPEAEEV